MLRLCRIEISPSRCKLNQPQEAQMTSNELKTIIEDRGLKKKALAAQLRVSACTITNWLNGATQIPWIFAYYIRTSVCGISVEEARKM